MTTAKENALTNLQTVLRSDLSSKYIKDRVLECLQKNCSDSEIGEVVRLAILYNAKVRK